MTNSPKMDMDLEKLLYIFEHNKNISFRKPREKEIVIYYDSMVFPEYEVDSYSGNTDVYIERTFRELFTVWFMTNNGKEKTYIQHGYFRSVFDKEVFSKIEECLQKNKENHSYVDQLIDNLYMECQPLNTGE